MCSISRELLRRNSRKQEHPMARQTSYSEALSAADVNTLCQAATVAWRKAQGWHRKISFSWKGECYQAIREKDGGARTQAMSRIMNTANVVVWIRICMGQLYLGRCFKGKPTECALAKSDAASTTNRLVRRGFGDSYAFRSRC